MPASERCPGQLKRWFREFVSTQHAQFTFGHGGRRSQLCCFNSSSAALTVRPIPSKTPYREEYYLPSNRLASSISGCSNALA